MQVLNRESYSAEAFATLYVGKESLRVARISRNTMILRETRDIAPCDAVIVVTVDGVKHEYPIHLFKGISADSRIVEFL